MALKDEAWRYLSSRADELSRMEVPDHTSLTTEELELIAGIKALEAIPGTTMKPQIEAMKAQLDQYKFKRDGKIQAAGTKAKEFKRLNLTERAFNELDFEKQNELLQFFFHRIVPAYKGQPAIFDAVFWLKAGLNGIHLSKEGVDALWDEHVVYKQSCQGQALRKSYQTID